MQRRRNVTKWGGGGTSLNSGSESGGGGTNISLPPTLKSGRDLPVAEITRGRLLLYSQGQVISKHQNHKTICCLWSIMFHKGI